MTAPTRAGLWERLEAELASVDGRDGKGRLDVWRRDAEPRRDLGQFRGGRLATTRINRHHGSRRRERSEC